LDQTRKVANFTRNDYDSSDVVCLKPDAARDAIDSRSVACSDRRAACAISRPAFRASARRVL